MRGIRTVVPASRCRRPLLRWTAASRLTLCIMTLLIHPVAARADDLWVMIGTTAPCGPLIWQADALFLNTSDQPATIRLLGLSDGADTVVRDLRYMLSLGDRRTDDGWRVPIVKTVASKGEGADELVDEIERHGQWLAASGHLNERRLKRASDEVEAIALTSLRVDLRNGSLEQLSARVVAGELDPYAAADELVASLDS